MQTLKGISLNRSIRQATVVFALFVAYAVSAAETQQAFADGATLAGDLVLRAAEVGDSATFRADGSFLMPAVDVARGEWPVGFFFGNNGTPTVGLHATTDAAKKGAVFAAQDAVARISLSQANAPEVVFEKGLFNFRNPGGTATENSLELISGGDRTVRILPDAVVRAGSVINTKPPYTDGTRSRLKIEGELDAAGDFDFSLGEWAGANGWAAATASVAVVEGGRLAVGGVFSLGKTNPSGNYFTRSWPTLALTNGTFAAGSLTFTHGALLSKDARVEIAGDFKYGMGNGWAETTRAIDLRGGSLTVGGKFSVQGRDETFTLTDVATSAAETFIGEAGTPCLRLVGGSYAAGTSFLLGKAGSANVVLEDGAVLSFASGCGTTIGEWRGTGTFDVVSGEIRLPAGDFWLNLGFNPSPYTGFGRLNLTDGRIVSAASATASENGIYIGQSGYGEMNVSGGSVDVPNIVLGRWEGAGDPTLRSVLNVSGGTVSARRISVSSHTGRYGDVKVTGGTLTTAALTGGNGEANLVADGGTFVTHAATAKGSDWIGGFTTAQIGTHGLTLDVTRAAQASQAFVDAAAGGGPLTKTGAAELTLTGVSGNAQTVVAGGRLALTATGGNPSGAFTVVNGAELAFSGAHEIGGLTLGDAASAGVLAFVPGETLTVKGAPAFPRVRLAIKGETTVGVTYAVVRAPGDLTATEAAAGWRRGKVVDGRMSGCAYAFETVYEAEKNETAFNLVVTTGGLPDDADLMRHSDSSTLTEAADAAGLLFNPAGALTLDGAAITLRDVGQPVIKAVSGNSTVQNALDLPSVVRVDVAEGASLALKGVLTDGGLEKTGKGHLSIDNPANVFTADMSVRAGSFEATPEALGAASGASCDFAVGNAAVAIRDEDKTPKVVPFAFVMAAQTTEAVAVSTDADVTFAASPHSTGGALVKLGAGRFALQAAEPGDYAYAFGDGAHDATGTFESLSPVGDKAVPTTGYTGFNVADGEVAFVGAHVASEAAPVFKIPHGIRLGLKTTAVSAAPGLVIDRCRAVVGGFFKHMLLAAEAYTGEYAPQAVSPYLFITNGASVEADTITCGTVVDAAKAALDVSPLVEVKDGSSLSVSSMINLSVRTGCRAKWTVSGGSAISTGNGGGFLWNGGVDFTLDASDATADRLSIGNAAAGTWLVRNGGRLNVRNVESSGTATPVTLAFDGGFFAPSDGDCEVLVKNASDVRFEAREGGLRLAVPADRTWTVRMPVSGAGGLVKEGAGTLVVGTAKTVSTDGMVTNDLGVATLACSGVTRVREGVVRLELGSADGAAFDVAAGATLDLGGGAHAISVTGAGTVANGALKRDSVIGQGTTFSNVEICNGVRIDVRAYDVPSRPSGLVIGTVSGTTTVSDSLLRLWGDETAAGYRGQLRVVDGTLLLDIVNPSGFVIRVR